jgi:hypothetical protein
MLGGTGIVPIKGRDNRGFERLAWGGCKGSVVEREPDYDVCDIELD